MAAIHSDEFKRDAVRIALTSGLTRRQVASDLGVGHSTLGRRVRAFSEESKVREARQKLERVGLTTYTQVVETKDGKRTRVRVGPFQGRAEAEKATAKIKGLGLPASILSL